MKNKRKTRNLSEVIRFNLSKKSLERLSKKGFQICSKYTKDPKTGLKYLCYYYYGCISKERILSDIISIATVFVAQQIGNAYGEALWDLIKRSEIIKEEV